MRILHLPQFLIYEIGVFELFLYGIQDDKIESKVNKIVNNPKDKKQLEELCTLLINPNLIGAEIDDYIENTVRAANPSTFTEKINLKIGNSHSVVSYNQLADKIFNNLNMKSTISNFCKYYYKQAYKLKKNICTIYEKETYGYAENIEDLKTLHYSYDVEDKEKINELFKKKHNLPIDLNENLKIRKRIPQIIEYITIESGFFDDRIFLYYLLFECHSIDINLIMQLRKQGINLDYFDDLIHVSTELASMRISHDHQQAKELLDIFFSYYGRFISNKDIIGYYSYSLKESYNYLVNPTTFYSLIKKLCYIYHYSFSFNPPQENIKEIKSEISNGAKRYLYHYPKQQEKSFDWKNAFGDAFPDLIKRDQRLYGLLGEINESDYTDREHYEIMISTLRYAAPISQDMGSFNRGIRNYENVPECNCGDNFKLPYIPLIDSDINKIYNYSDFEFESDRQYNAPKPDIAIFDDIHIWEKLRQNAIEKAHLAGRAGVSERKIFIYDTSIKDDSGPFKMKIGKIDFFTALSRRDFFLQYLSPSDENLSKLLIEWLRYNFLEVFLPEYNCAKELQVSFEKEEEKDKIENSIKLDKNYYTENTNDFDYRPRINQVKALMYEKIQKLYKQHVDMNVSGLDGGYYIGNTGTTFTGCGTFVLTTERDERGNDLNRPMLLFERRWQVSEQSGTLCYPSAGSCEMYVPSDYKDLAEKVYIQYKHQITQNFEEINDRVFKYEEEWKLEASPFLTACRELKEELELNIEIEDLEFVSFGIDVNRNLQQFSFLHISKLSANEILEKAKLARDSNEGITFIIPFKKNVINEILKNYQLEPAAVYSLLRILEIKKDLLWDNGN